MKAGQFLLQNNLFTLYNKTNDDYPDFVSMLGGSYKQNTDTETLLTTLFKCKRKKLECGLTPVMKNINTFLFYLDFDFKQLSLIENMEDLCKLVITSIINISIIEEDKIKLIIFNRDNNIHIYTNLVVNKQIACYLVEELKTLFINKYGTNKNSDNRDIIDNLNNYNTGIRLEGFNKKGVEGTAYKYYGTYIEEELDTFAIHPRDWLKVSCYYDMDYINEKHLLILKEEFKMKLEKEINEKKEEEQVDNSLIHDDTIMSISNIFKSPILLKNFFSYNNTYQLKLSLIKYCQTNKYNKPRTIKLINNFFNNIIDIKTEDKSTGKTYKQLNEETVEKYFNSNINITFGTVVYLVGQIDEDLKNELINILPHQTPEEVLDIKLKEYEENTELTEEDKRNFNLDFFNTVLMNLKYPMNIKCMKVYFERYYIYVMKEDSFYQKVIEYVYDRKGTKQEILKLDEYKENSLRKFKVKTNENKKLDFLEYLKDENFHKYMKVVFNPTGVKRSNNYNLFNGYGYSKIEEVITEEHREKFNKFIDYIKMYVCSGDEEIYDYFINFLANIIQEPDFKPHISYVFYSSEKGTGKSSFCKMLKKLIGDLYSFIGNIRMIFNTHSTASEFKILNVIEELDKKLCNETIEQLKDNIQRDDCILNKKYKDIVEMKDYVRYIITLNDFKSLQLDRNQRRFVFLNFKPVEDKETLDIINEVYERNSNIYVRLLGDYLMNYKIKYETRTEWRENRKSDKCQNLFYKVSTIEQFFIDIYKNEGEIYGECYKPLIEEDIYSMSLTNFYNIYKSLQDKFKLSKVNFRKQLSEYDFIEINKPYSKSKLMVNINMKELFSFLTGNILIQDEEYNLNYELEQEEE